MKKDNKTFGFGVAIEKLKNGEVVSRQSWEENKYVVKQIDSLITEQVIPIMTSLPSTVKELIMSSPSKTINYHEQCLIVTQTEDANYATNYVPNWVDIFADDWCVVTM